MGTDRDEDLVEEIIELTGSPGSRTFYRQAIKRHGYEPVRQEYSELHSRIQTRAHSRDPIREPARLFTKMLKDLNERSAQPYKGKPISCFFETLDEYFESTLVTKPAQDDMVDYDTAMEVPYSGKGIPWPTALGPEFFTLSTNKSKSDMVTTTIRTAYGETAEVPLCRGKGFPSDNEWGIATAEDSRIIKALIIIWQEDDFKKTEGTYRKCWCQFSIRRLARTMGYTNFGGKNLKYLARRLSRLSSIAYYLDLDGIRNGTRLLYFIDKPLAIETKIGGRKEIIFLVTFSEFLSRMFLKRKTITRSHDLVRQTNELALLLQDYIESRVKEEVENKKGFSISLQTLIKHLFLPPANWHRFKSQRRNVFEKAIGELNGSTTWDGDAFFASIVDNADRSDYLLRVKRTSIIDAPELPFIGKIESVQQRRYLVAREKAVNAYVSKFERGLGNLAYALRQYASLRRATDPE